MNTDSRILTAHSAVAAAAATDRAAEAAQIFRLPPCAFAGGLCKQCDWFTWKDHWCERHSTTVDPNKWSCSEFT